MAINSVLAKINNVTIPKVTDFEIERNKLWTNADRDLGGSLHADLVGIFPKILLKIGYTTQAEMQTLITLLDQASFNLAWWDEKTQTLKTGLYYPGDFKYGIFLKDKGLYKPFNVNLIPYEPLT